MDFYQNLFGLGEMLKTNGSIFECNKKCKFYLDIQSFMKKNKKHDSYTPVIKGMYYYIPPQKHC